jgi:hypothetical protein
MSILEKLAIASIICILTLHLYIREILHNHELKYLFILGIPLIIFGRIIKRERLNRNAPLISGYVLSFYFCIYLGLKYFLK